MVAVIPVLLESRPAGRLARRRACASHLPLERRCDLVARSGRGDRIREKAPLRSRRVGQRAAPRPRRGNRRVRAGQRLVPSHRTRRLLLAVEHPDALSALPDPHRGARWVFAGHAVLPGIAVSAAGPLGGVVAGAPAPRAPRSHPSPSVQQRTGSTPRERRDSAQFVSDKMPLWPMQRFAVVVFPAFVATVRGARLAV